MSASLSRNQRYRLTVVSTMALLALSGFMWIKPLFDELQSKQAELSQAKSVLPPEKHYNPTFTALASSLAKLRTDLAAKRRSFPVAENVSSLLVELEALASEQVTIRHFYPTKLAAVKLPPDRAKAGISVSEQQIELHAEGAFPSLHGMLSRFERYAHPLGVNAISLERTERAPIAGGGGPQLTSRPKEHLMLKMKLSAYLLDRPLPDAPLFGEGLSDQLAAAQIQAGVADPFVKLDPDVPPIAAVPKTPLAGAPAVMTLPAPSLPVPSSSSHNELAGWHVEGILCGPGSVAIIRRNSEPSMTVRVGDQMDGWKVSLIEAESVVFSRGTQRERLSLPSGLL